MLEIRSLKCCLPGWGTDLTRVGSLERLLGWPFPLRAIGVTAFDEKILRQKILWWKEGRKGWVVWEGALKVIEMSLIYSF